MAEVFTSVYRKEYRGHPDHKRVGLLIPLDIYSASQQDDQYIKLPDKQKKEWCETSNELIKRLYQNRMKTTYRVSYCRERAPPQKPSTEIKVSRTDTDNSSGPNEDVLITYFSKLYELPKTQKLLPPVPTSRRVNGYCRPALQYTQLSHYQATHCKTAFDLLKKDFDRGINRLGSRRKKPEDLQPIM